jgi:chromate reductase
MYQSCLIEPSLIKKIIFLKGVFMKILCFAASYRKESLNKKLIHKVCHSLEQKNIEVIHKEFEAFDCPLFKGITGEPLPKEVEAFKTLIREVQGLIISTPEYNNAMPGTLKNLIDWVSTEKPSPFFEKPLLLISASPSEAGGRLGLWNSRIPFEALFTLVYPEMFALSKAHQAFENELIFKDPALETRLENLLERYTAFVNSQIHKNQMAKG